MYSLKGNYLEITQGDTGEINVTLAGDEFTSSDKAQITFSRRDGTILLEKVAGITDNVASFSFDIDDTADISEGDYQWEIALVKGAVVSGGHIVSGTSKYTPHVKPMPLRINNALLDINGGA